MTETKAWLVVLDVANGYSEHFVQFVRKVRASLPEATIVAGNVVTGTHAHCCQRERRKENQKAS